MDDLETLAITDPASVLLGIGAICALFASRYWIGVARSIDTGGLAVTGPDKRKLASAAMLTALALGLAAAGYLLGRFTGRF